MHKALFLGVELPRVEETKILKNEDDLYNFLFN